MKKNATAIARVAELEAEISERRLDYTEDCKRLEAAINDFEHQLAAAQERERWIPASEAPPKNGPYLILFKGKVIYATFLTNGWYQGYYANSVVPDAWRELPAPPEEAADAE